MGAMSQRVKGWSKGLEVLKELGRGEEKLSWLNSEGPDELGQFLEDGASMDGPRGGGDEEVANEEGGDEEPRAG